MFEIELLISLTEITEEDGNLYLWPNWQPSLPETVQRCDAVPLSTDACPGPGFNSCKRIFCKKSAECAEFIKGLR